MYMRSESVYASIQGIDAKERPAADHQGHTIPPRRHLRSDLALDESQRLRSIPVDILLVGIGVVSIAAVRVRGIAVGLDDARVGRGAREARGASRESRSLARTHVVREAVAVVRVAHEDGGLDGGQGFAGEGGTGAAAEGVVEDLPALNLGLVFSHN